MRKHMIHRPCGLFIANLSVLHQHSDVRAAARSLHDSRDRVEASGHMRA